MNAKSFMAIALFSLLLWAGLIGLVKFACGADIYLNAVTGDDWAAGTISAPWKTCSAVNRATPAGDDFINFQGGQAFGAIQNDTTLAIPTSGTAGHPVTYRSTPGTGRATITGAAPPSVWGTGTGWEPFGAVANTYYHLIAKDDSVYACWKSDTLMTRVMTAKPTSHNNFCVRTAAGATLDTLVCYWNAASDTVSVWRSKASAIYSAKDYITVQGMRIIKGTSTRTGSSVSCSNIQIVNIGDIITNCMIDSILQTGIFASSYNGEISNTIIRQPSYGIYLTATADSILIYNNTIYSGSYHINVATGAIKSTIKNNIFKDATSRFLGISDASACNISNNQYYDLSYTTKWAYSGTTYSSYSTWAAASGDVNSQTGDPQFTNAASGDFTLKQSSPCRDKGTDVGITVDFAGNPVPMPETRPPDIGAYEYQLYNSRKLIITSKRPRM